MQRGVSVVGHDVGCPVNVVGVAVSVAAVALVLVAMLSFSALSTPPPFPTCAWSCLLLPWSS